MFQFTRPQGARPQLTNGGLNYGRFQFTRPQGARRYSLQIGQYNTQVSIHAPTRGATLFQLCISISRFCFNSRAHKGRDISFLYLSLDIMGFNSRAHKGRDFYMLYNSKQFYKFQFTRPQGARRNSVRQISYNLRFNSRAHKGRDSISFCTTAGSGLFQFTRPQGARPFSTASILAFR